MVLSLPILIATSRFGIGTDYFTYYSIYQSYSNLSFISPRHLSVEYGYYLINFIAAYFYIYLVFLEILFIFVGAYYVWGVRLTYYTMSVQVILVPAIVRNISEKYKKLLYRLNLKIYRQGKVTEENFGTVGAIASAFVPGFLPLAAVQNQEIWGQQRPEGQTFFGVRAIP
ncbi:EpsG family protein [Paenibacillus sp. FSL R10-2771]|uniref:EpsG family protein n=1 Tax=Paenibacillus sp. FSL R10-2771 TaxID=2954693 RepID=UPI004046C433